MDDAFERAVDIVASLSKNSPIQTGYDDKLVLYGFFKQATEGPPRTSRPGVLDLLGRAKWDAWKKKEALGEQDAKRGYVESLKKILRGYGDRPEAVDFGRELDRLLQQGGSRDLLTSGSLIDSDVSSEEEERRQYRVPRSRHSSAQESSQNPSSRTTSHRGGQQQQQRTRSSRQPQQRPIASESEDSDDDSAPASLASAQEYHRNVRQPAHHPPPPPPQQPRYALSAQGSTFGGPRMPPPVPSVYATPSGHASQAGYLPIGGRPPSAGPMARSPFAPMSGGTPAPDIEGLRGKLSALEQFLTQPDVPEDRRRQVEIEIAKTRGYLAVISQRYNASTPTTGISLSELQARQQQTLQRIQASPGGIGPAPKAPSPAVPPPAPNANLERALDSIQTSLTALNERLSRLEHQRSRTPPPTTTPLLELLNRVLYFLHLREPQRGEAPPRWSWLTLFAVVRGAVTDVAFLAFLIGLAVAMRRHGVSWRAVTESWRSLVLLGAGSEAIRRIEAAQ